MNGAIADTDAVGPVGVRAGARPRSLTHAASRGMLWSGLTVTARSAIRFITTAILARQLLPVDFGVLGMAFVVNEAIVLLGELGLGMALIQKKTVDETYYHTLFWASLGVGVLLGGVFFAAAPVAAAFFDTPQVRPVIMFLSLNFLLSSSGSVFRAILTRQLRFDRFALINISSTVVRSAVALGAVFAGWGLWSVLFGMLAERVAMLTLLTRLVRWRPRFEFRPDKFWDLFRFSRNLYGENFLRFFNRKSDVLITGKLIGATGLGFYHFASGIPSLVFTHFSQTITEVLFPVYCKVQDDNARFRRGYLKTVSFTSLIASPLMVGLIVVAPEFIQGIYGDKWLPVAAPMRALCVLALANAVFHTMGSVLYAKGRPDIGLKWNTVMLPVTVLGLLTGARWGVEGIAWAMLAVGLLSVIPMGKAIALIELPATQLLRALVPGAGAAVVMACGLMLMKAGVAALGGISSAALTLAWEIPAGAALYAAALRVLWPETVRDFLQLLRQMVTR